MYISYSHIFPSYPYYPFLCDLWPFRAIPDLVYFSRCQSSESISARFPDPKDTLEALKMLDEAQDVLLCESSQLFCKEKNPQFFFGSFSHEKIAIDRGCPIVIFDYWRVIIYIYILYICLYIYIYLFVYIYNNNNNNNIVLLTALTRASMSRECTIPLNYYQHNVLISNGSFGHVLSNNGYIAEPQHSIES